MPYQINSFEEYQVAYKQSIDNPEGFWGEIAEHFVWKKKWDKVLNWNFKEPTIEWFKGGKPFCVSDCRLQYVFFHLGYLAPK